MANIPRGASRVKVLQKSCKPGTHDTNFLGKLVITGLFSFYQAFQFIIIPLFQVFQKISTQIFLIFYVFFKVV